LRGRAEGSGAVVEASLKVEKAGWGSWWREKRGGRKKWTHEQRAEKQMREKTVRGGRGRLTDRKRGTRKGQTLDFES